MKQNTELLLSIVNQPDLPFKFNDQFLLIKLEKKLNCIDNKCDTEYISFLLLFTLMWYGIHIYGILNMLLACYVSNIISNQIILS